MYRAIRGNKNPFPRDLPPVGREIAAFGKDTPGDVKAFPSARGAHFPQRPAHPRGEVLEMAHRIAEESRRAVRRVFHDPL